MPWGISIIDRTRPSLNFPECNLSLAWTWVNAGVKCSGLLVGCILLWLSRNLPPVFNEVRQISTVMYLLSLASITVLPILASDKGTALDTRYVVRALGIILIVCATSSILFIPKLTLAIVHTAAQSSVFKGRSWKGDTNYSSAAPGTNNNSKNSGKNNNTTGNKSVADAANANSMNGNDSSIDTPAVEIQLKPTNSV